MKIRLLSALIVSLAAVAANADNDFFNLSYDPATGNIGIAGGPADIATVELISAGGNFTGAKGDFGHFGGLFDVYTNVKAFKLDPAGFNNINPFASFTTGLSEADFTADISASGAPVGGGKIGPGGAINIEYLGATPSFCDGSTAEICIDFDGNPAPANTLSFGTSEVRTDGGNPGGYLSVTDAANGQRGTIIVPTAAGNVVTGGRTGGANAAHHVDNIEITTGAGGAFKMDVDLRVGGGTDRPADGFSFSLVGDDDPIIVNGDGNGYASSPTGEANLPEEGTQTGVSVGFDEWFSGGEDVIGLSLRIDGELVAQFELPTLNGANDDSTSLQTGPRGPDGPGDISALGWSRLSIDHDPSRSTILGWKGESYEYVPEPAAASMLLVGLLSLGFLRRRK